MKVEALGLPWRAERSKRDRNRVIVRRADGAWLTDFEGENAEEWANFIVDTANSRTRPWDQRQFEELKPYLPDIVKNAMLVAWREICSDTDCHPLDIEHGKRKHLTFEPRHWAQMAGEFVAATLERFWSEQASYADLRASGGISEGAYLTVEEAVLRERERCAKVAELYSTTLRNGGAINACRSIAKGIRSWAGN